MFTSPAMPDDLTSFIVANEGPVLSQLTSVSPISITSDAGFASHLLGFPGNGSESDPYRIENYDIEGTLGGNGILIGGSVTVYYEIRNCRVHNTFTGTGINLQAGHGVIDSCEIMNHTWGVSLAGSDYLITSTEIYDTSFGINAFQVDDVSLVDSNFENADVVLFEEVSGLNILGNTFSASQPVVWNSDSFSVSGNTFNIEEYNEWLALDGSQIGTVEGNIFNINNNTGIWIKNCQSIIITDCDFIASGPSGAGWLGVDFRGFSGTRDITIQDCLFESVNCDGQNIEEGLLITNCVLNSGSIGLVDSPGSEVSSNTLTNGQIHVAYNCNGSLVYNNTLTDCPEYGLYIRENNTDLLVSTNTMKGSKSQDDHGINLQSDGVTLYNNVIENFDSGIYIDGDDGTICNNTLFGNNIGIEIDSGSSSNNLYYNILYDNTQNANDDGSDNTWDDGVSLGNYWGNLNAPGEYVIPGSAGSVDRYARPYRIPIIPPSPQVLLILVGAGVVGVAVAVVCLRRR